MEQGRGIVQGILRLYQAGYEEFGPDWKHSLETRMKAFGEHKLPPRQPLISSNLRYFCMVAETTRTANTAMVKFLRKLLDPDPDYHQNLIISSLIHLPSFHQIL